MTITIAALKAISTSQAILTTMIFAALKQTQVTLKRMRIKKLSDHDVPDKSLKKQLIIFLHFITLKNARKLHFVSYLIMFKVGYVKYAVNMV